MNQITRYIVAVSILCFGLLFGTYGFSADKNPCDEDVAKFCRDIKPGTAAVMECLEAHEDKLSAACKAYESQLGGVRGKYEMREQVRYERNIRHSCMEDIKKFCKDISAEQGGVAECLRKQEKNLSADCRESLKAADVEK